MSDQYEETYYIVPSYIRKLPGMTLGYMDVYNIIFQFWNKGRECFLKNEAFTERTGFTGKYIRNALAYFENLGELKRVMRGKKRYLVRPEKRIEIESEHEQAVDKNAMVELQFRNGGTTVPPKVELQFQKKKRMASLKAMQLKASSVSSSRLNKESLNKEFKYHEDDNAKHSEKSDESFMQAKLEGLGMNPRLASKVVRDNALSAINNILEIAKEQGAKNVGAYLHRSIKNLQKI